MGIGFAEIFILFLLVLLFFGAKRLPEVARAMGKAVNEFKKAKNEIIVSPEPFQTTHGAANPSINKETKQNKKSVPITPTGTNESSNE